MKVRFQFDLDIPEEVVKEFSELNDVSFYGHQQVQKLIREMDGCDDFPMSIYSINGKEYLR